MALRRSGPLSALIPRLQPGALTLIALAFGSFFLNIFLDCKRMDAIKPGDSATVQVGVGRLGWEWIESATIP